MSRIERALLSVSDKEGLVAFARALSEQGVELYSSGGTAKLLRQEGLAVTLIADYTGSPEILGGRVKTLHPKIFGGILARDSAEHRQQLTDNDISRFDLVVVNLYPFEQTIAREDVTLPQAIEQIDIGGPSLIRAAAKNHERVAVVVRPEDYPAIIEELGQGAIGEQTRQDLARRAFAYTAAYDAAISNYLERQTAGADAWPEHHTVQLQQLQGLRYGENPHQTGGFYGWARRAGQAPEPRYAQLQGKELSYNNIVDVDAAWGLVQDLPGIAVAIIKHTNPCGAASVVEDDLSEAFKRALKTDPVSAFGGIVACNRVVDAATAGALREIFLEVVVAPEFSSEAREILAKKKKLRLIAATDRATEGIVWRSAFGGVLLQQQDVAIEQMAEAQVRSEREPTASQLRDLQFAWAVCKHVKSNAIVLVREGQLVGVGAGQMSRVDSVELAIHKARLAVEGCVLASDAFFPFRDGVDKAAAAGVAAVVQPGGSVRDEEVIGAANEHQIAMLFSGARHFRH